MSDNDPEVVKDFLIESLDHLDRAEQDLLDLERHPDPTAALTKIFRCIHTIKGTCGFLAFRKLESVTHTGESLLARLRDGALAPSPPITDVLLRLVDCTRRMLGAIEANGTDGEEDYSELVAEMKRWCQPQPGQAGAASVSPPPAPAPVAAAPSATLSRAPDSVPPAVPEPASPPVAPAAPAPAASTPPETPRAADTTIRVDVHLLDKLMNLAGELVLCRNQLVKVEKDGDPAVFAAGLQRLNLITSEVQEAIMRTRMQPIGAIWGKLPRVVRDIALSTGKQVKLETEGEQVGLDRSILEAIKDPLTHLLRNAVDHGIEPPETRLARAKAPEGRLQLRAIQEGGQVTIELNDDGGGINVDRVKGKALQLGLITSEQAKRMSERELLRLIFLPGFSTAEKVTNLSGRGVGMDVVKTNIEKIGGTVEVTSELGKGTTFQIKIPLTLAIIPALVVRSGHQSFAIPQASLLEVVLLLDENARHGIEHVHGAPVHRLRGSLLPLVWLDRVLGTKPAVSAGPKEPLIDDVQDVLSIVVLQALGQRFGLIVDEIGDTEEIVVKPLGKLVNHIPVFAGATISGDGQVILILDVVGIAQKSRVLSEAARRPSLEAAAGLPRGLNETELLLFQMQDDSRLAMPLSSVARLEEIPRSRVERAGSEDVVVYGDVILPLFSLSALLKERRHRPRLRGGLKPRRGKDDEILHMVVCSDGGQAVGLVVDQILDVTEADLGLRRAPSRPGILYSVLVEKRITEVLDVGWIMEQVNAAGPGKEAAR